MSRTTKNITTKRLTPTQEKELTELFSQREKLHENFDIQTSVFDLPVIVTIAMDGSDDGYIECVEVKNPKGRKLNSLERSIVDNIENDSAHNGVDDFDPAAKAIEKRSREIEAIDSKILKICKSLGIEDYASDALYDCSNAKEFIDSLNFSIEEEETSKLREVENQRLRAEREIRERHQLFLTLKAEFEPKSR